MYKNQKITYEPFLALDSADPRSVTIRESFIIQRYEDNKVYLYELTQPLELWETEPDNLTIDDIKVKIKELIETQYQEGDPLITAYNSAKADKELETAKVERFKDLNDWLTRPYVDSVKGWTIDISRDSRSTLHQYENKQRKKLSKGDITASTPNPLITLSHGLVTVTLEELEDLNIRIGDDVEDRTFKNVTIGMQINAATTISEVEAITW